MVSEWIWNPEAVDPNQLYYTTSSSFTLNLNKDPIEERLGILSSLGYGWMDLRKIPKVNFDFFIKKVIFNGPATIVIWKDGTKTVVKCMDTDVYDREKGLMMAIMEKLLGGTKGDVKRFFKKHIPENDEEAYGINEVLADILSGLFTGHKEESSDE